jgi:pimeloyl-ACP methyl ester carboxylesterase
MTQKTWVLLRGLTRESGHWGAFPALLQARLGEAGVITLDLPGNGALHAQASPLCVHDMAEACRSALRAQGIAPPYHLLAMSLGGMVAVDWASRASEEIAGAVLINTSLRGISPLHWRLRPANWPWLLRLMLRWRQPLRCEEIVLRLTSRLHAPGTPAGQALLGQWAALRQQHPVSAANALRQLWAAARYTAPPQCPPVPLLLLTSQHDGLVDTRCSQRLAQHWQAALATHASAGHDLPLDDGAWVAEQVSCWATELGVAPATALAANAAAPNAPASRKGC